MLRFGVVWGRAASAVWVVRGRAASVGEYTLKGDRNPWKDLVLGLVSNPVMHHILVGGAKP
jgi:hypothetical protein